MKGLGFAGPTMGFGVSGIECMLRSSSMMVPFGVFTCYRTKTLLLSPFGGTHHFWSSAVCGLGFRVQGLGTPTVSWPKAHKV